MSLPPPVALKLWPSGAESGVGKFWRLLGGSRLARCCFEGLHRLLVIVGIDEADCRHSTGNEGEEENEGGFVREGDGEEEHGTAG